MTAMTSFSETRLRLTALRTTVLLNWPPLQVSQSSISLLFSLYGLIVIQLPVPNQIQAQVQAITD